MLSLEFEIFMYFLKTYIIFGLVRAKKNAVSTPKKVFYPCIFKYHVSVILDTRIMDGGWRKKGKLFGGTVLPNLTHY